MSLRIVLVDDENVLRGALRRVLEWEDDIEVVADVGDPTEVVALVEGHRPDILLSDITMPGMDGIELSRQVLAARPETGVVLLTRHARPGLLREALAAGVRGFLSKDADAGHIAEVLRTVAGGSPYIDSSVAARAVNDANPLTDRELEVLQAARDGAPVREIGQRLHLAPSTVRNYLSEAIGKLAAANRHEAARIAEERGWI